MTGSSASLGDIRYGVTEAYGACNNKLEAHQEVFHDLSGQRTYTV